MMDFWHIQAEQFRQWYEKQPGREWEDAFAHWADSKDFASWDRLAIRALACRSQPVREPRTQKEAA